MQSVHGGLASGAQMLSRWQFLYRGRWFSSVSPGCIHADLLRHRLIENPLRGAAERRLAWIGEQDWHYRTKVRLPRGREHVALAAHGLDTLAEVRLDGQRIGRTDNMFQSHTWDVTRAADGAKHEIEVVFGSVLPEIRRRARHHDFAGKEWCDPVGGRSTVRKSQCNFGWDWGPRFITCGFFRPVELVSWDGNKLEHAKIVQRHRRGGVVDLEVIPVLSTPDPGARYRTTLRRNGRVVAATDGLSLSIAKPELWWPSGHGPQALYDLTLDLLGPTGSGVSSLHRRIGFRTIELDRSRDSFGESFRFVVNGRAIFAKGANWIPAHCFPHYLTRADYEPLLRSAARANMNMLRVWGGGIYEHECFYDLCDELGLLVWQDFMFACSLYPGDREFLESCRVEAEQQVARLHDRASLALWCGNNEIEQLSEEIAATPRRTKAYRDLFYGVLPAAVTKHDGATAYWPASPHNPEGFDKGHNNERAGDAHLWDVWHSLAPVRAYEDKKHRFVSEFGMQSFPHPDVAASFCATGEFNILSPAFEAHQKNGNGNSIILHYVGSLYRFPDSYASLAYLSQLNQAHCMRVAVEHFRRSMPRCMGTLYWQLNDCWPAASWSSIDFGGKWKALHYEARRFYAPVLLSPVLDGSHSLHATSNTNRYDYRGLAWDVVTDKVEPGPAELRWFLFHVGGRRLASGMKRIDLRPGRSVKALQVDLRRELSKHGEDQVVAYAQLRRGRRMLADNSALFVAPRLLSLQRTPVSMSCKRIGQDRWRLRVASRAYHHRVELSVEVRGAEWSDNYFDLLPGIARTVELSGAAKLPRRGIKVRSLVHTSAG